MSLLPSLNGMRFCVFFFLFSTQAWAQIVWDKRELEFQPGLAATNQLVSFSFVNKGGYPVVVTGVQASCGCTTATLQKRRYEPGEKGVVEANFNFGQRVGLQEKTLTVSMDNLKESTALLHFKVQIPELLKIRPSYLSWTVGEGLVAKKLTIEAMSEPVVKVTAKTSSKDFKIELKPLGTPDHYELVVTPFDTRQTHWGVFAIQAEMEDKSIKPYQVYGQVRPAGAASFDHK